MMGRKPEIFALSDQQRLTSRESGFTLVELMVAITLSLFLIGAVTLTYLSARATSLEAEQLSRMQESLRFASDFLVRDIRNAGFRDQLTLTFNQYKTIGKRYAEINGNQLTIRYAGRGACGRALGTGAELKLVENTYFVESGELRCTGTEEMVTDITENTDGTLSVDKNIETEENVVLATGLRDVEFSFVPSGSALSDGSALYCDYFDPNDLPLACLGVQISLTFAFEGQPDRTAQIKAAFRNVILDRLFERKTI